MTVTASHVTVHRQGREILHDVSMSAQSGEVTGLIGPNGAGKSTLLAALSGDTSLSSGSVQLVGQDVSGLSLIHI